MLRYFFEGLQHNSWIVAMNSSAWMSAVLEVVHYFSFFVVVGATAVVDLRIMGVAGRKQSAARLAEQAFPWIWTGLCFSVLSGFVMFAGQATDYFHNSIFHRKLLVILLAAVFAAWVQHGVLQWEQSAPMPARAKLVALVSLALWVGAILMGVDVPAITG